MRWEVLDTRWRTMSDSFNLFDAGDRTGVIESFSEFKPDIVVIDTLTRVTSGQDINAPAVGAGINNYADELAVAFGGLVILIHHPGKDKSRGGMGSALIESLAYAVWRVSKEDGNTVRCWVDKMKDGPADFAVHYGIGWTTPGNVPCVRDQTAAEAKQTRRQDVASKLRQDVLNILAQCPGREATTQEVAHKLIADSPGGDVKRLSANMVRCLQRGIVHNAKPGPLADLVERDQYGEAIKPYKFCLPVNVG